MAFLLIGKKLFTLDSNRLEALLKDGCQTGGCYFMEGFLLFLYRKSNFPHVTLIDALPVNVVGGYFG